MGTPWPPRGPDDLDDEQRARIRRRVLAGVRPLRRSLGDRASEVWAVLALPAPYIVRALISATVIVSIVGTATVASADSLPAEPLYAVKLASEQVRLALARTPEDRASVQLSMAEHRLAEAMRLIREGRDADAVETTAAYGTHLATAAAALAAVERLSVAARPVIEQLKQRLAEQQHEASDMAGRPVDRTTPVGAQVLRAIASFAPALPSGSTVSEAIAEHAANVTEQLAAVAERAATPLGATEQLPPAAAPPTDGSSRVGTTVADAGSNARPLTTTRPTVDPKKLADAKAAAWRAKQEAEKARIAAGTAKEAAKRTASPRPTPKR